MKETESSPFRREHRWVVHRLVQNDHDACSALKLVLGAAPGHCRLRHIQRSKSINCFPSFFLSLCSSDELHFALKSQCSTSNLATMDAIAKASSVRDLLSLVDKDCENNDPELLGELIEKFRHKIQKLEKSLTDPKTLKNRATWREILLNSNHEDHKAAVQDMFDVHSQDCANKMENSKNEEGDCQKKHHGKSKKGGSRKKKAMKGQVRKAVLAGLRKMHKTMPQKAAWVLEQADLEVKEMKEQLEGLRTIKETLENLLRCHNEKCAGNAHETKQSVSPILEENEEDNFSADDAEESIGLGGEEELKEDVDEKAIEEDSHTEESECETPEQPPLPSDNSLLDNRDKEMAELLCQIWGGEDSIDFGDEEEQKEAEICGGEDSVDLGDEEEQKECSFEQAKEMDCNNPEQRPLPYKLVVNEKKNEGPEDENLLAFCQSIGPSTDINGNQVPLSTRRKTRLPVQPQLFALENPNDPNLKCTTCDKVIGNNCASFVLLSTLSESPNL